LFQFRGAHKVSMPRRFDASCGGRVDAGETYDQAVVRETREELGIETNPQFIGKVFIDSPKEYKFINVYKSFHTGPFSGWEDEAEALEWMSIDEARTLYARFPYLFCGVESMKLLMKSFEGK
jgi:8-oxo-dGTP pyrophosphatase MutT (NUDIX family)